jgi:ABC-type branched-subunit amino acid transport system ATPase component
MTSPESPLKLHINHISLSFGGIRALNDIDFQVREGEICAVIGPNGAGKTSRVASSLKDAILPICRLINARSSAFHGHSRTLPCIPT